KLATIGLGYGNLRGSRPTIRFRMRRGGLIESSGDRRQRTKLVEVATQFKYAHLIHRTINGSGNLAFGYCTTQIAKSWGTVSHETTSLQNTVTLNSINILWSLPQTRLLTPEGFNMSLYGEHSN